MDFRSFLKDNLVILDGATGTVLQRLGLKPGEGPELWNITHPEEILKLQTEYFTAGSNLVCADTFGASPLKYDEALLEKIVKAALEISLNARKKSGGNQEKFIGLDIGASGKLLKPYGDLDFEEAVSAFGKTMSLGEKYGADVIFIQTMNDCYETKAAVIAAKEYTKLPVIVCNAYGADGKLVTGASPEAMAAMLEGLGVDAIGANCSFGPDKLREVIERLLAVSSVPVIFKPNAGMPEVRDGKTVYSLKPAEFAEKLSPYIGKGVRMVGGCCGTDPEYIKLLAESVKCQEPKPVTPKNLTCISSYTHALYFGKKPVLIGERINPTGKKRFKQALIENDINYVLEEGLREQEAGAHALDVNVGIPDINEKELLPKVVTALQSVTDLPLQIDTTDSEALERAARIYNGKPLINSVNGTKKSMDTVFPIAKKYGGAIIALTLDENGIPDNAEERVKIAENILREAEKYGILPKDIIFDTLTMTVSADEKAAVTTISALSAIRQKFGSCTSLGVSNVSFGLPERDIINTAFFTMALSAGLDAAIMNPFSDGMMGAYKAFVALKGFDEKCMDYIGYATKKQQTGDNETGLKHSVIKGLKEQAALDASALISGGTDPLSVINDEIVPALNYVGKCFEDKTMFLPQLLMSALAAQSAVVPVKEAVPADSMNKKCSVVLATVKGDVHDIGKNIVKLLLENYGFDVHDLGRDVPPETVLKAVEDTKAPLLGLSALMTTTVPAMEETIRLVRSRVPECRIVVGGAVLSKEIAYKIGADKYASDAMETVHYAMEINENK